MILDEEQGELPHEDLLVTVIATIALSVLAARAHRRTLADRYAAWFRRIRARAGPSSRQSPAAEVPLRNAAGGPPRR